MATHEMEKLLDTLCDAVRVAAPGLSFDQIIATMIRFVALFLADNMVHPGEFIPALVHEAARRLLDENCGEPKVPRTLN